MQKIFALSHHPMDNSLHVYLNGVEQQENVDWIYHVNPPRVVAQDAMAALADDLLEAEYAWLATSTDGGGSPTGPNTYPVTHSASTPSVASAFANYNPPSCPGNANYWGTDGYFDYPFGPSIRADGAARHMHYIGLVFGGSSHVSFSFYTDSGVIGTEIAYWIDPVTGCVTPHSINSGSIDTGPRDAYPPFPGAILVRVDVTAGTDSHAVFYAEGQL